MAWGSLELVGYPDPQSILEAFMDLPQQLMQSLLLLPPDSSLAAWPFSI